MLSELSGALPPNCVCKWATDSNRPAEADRPAISPGPVGFSVGPELTSWPERGAWEGPARTALLSKVPPRRCAHRLFPHAAPAHASPAHTRRECRAVSFPEGQSTLLEPPRRSPSSDFYGACAWSSLPSGISAHAGRKKSPRSPASCFCVVACARGYADTRKEEMDLAPKLYKAVTQRADTGTATGKCLDSCCKMVA